MKNITAPHSLEFQGRGNDSSTEVEVMLPTVTNIYTSILLFTSYTIIISISTARVVWISRGKSR